jgi:threonine synthase
LYDYIKEERSLGYGESNPCEYSRLLTCEKSGLELGLALPAEKADQPKELAWRTGKALPEERKPQDLLQKLLGALVRR